LPFLLGPFGNKILEYGKILHIISAIDFLRTGTMDVTIEKVRGTVIAKLPAEAVNPDARLRANLVALIGSRSIKALLIDMVEIPEMSDQLAALITTIEHQAGTRELKVVYFDVPQRVREFLEASGLSDVLEICRTRLEALRPFL
jgi:anti-anti-sigma regulatory factor